MALACVVPGWRKHSRFKVTAASFLSLHQGSLDAFRGCVIRSLSRLQTAKIARQIMSCQYRFQSNFNTDVMADEQPKLWVNIDIPGLFT